MKKALVLGLLFMLSVSLVIAARPDFTSADVTPSKSRTTVGIPTNAVEIADGVFDLGYAIDERGRIVQGYAFFLRPEYTKSTKDSEESSTESTCYSFLESTGAEWKTQESYLVDPTNNQELDQLFISQNLAGAIDEWETEAGYDVFGDEIAGIVDAASIGNVPNGNNEFTFGSIDTSGVIAVTYVWGVFRGKPENRVLTEWDMVFDEVDFSWANDGDVSAMDFENIAQHELGHALGLGHPDSTCTEETMYAYASNGETKKRDLFDGDKAGIFKLYN